VFDFPFNGLLLLLGAALGWAWARRGAGIGATGTAAASGDALAGLSNLARDDADQAIVALSRAVESEPGAVELQLTLGGLFRKRGEIDRAIQLHEAALTAPGLSGEQVAQARLELAHDYLKGGVMDRAEALAQSVLAMPAYAGEALELMLDLYEQARDWPQAIATAQRWESVNGRSAAPRVAQYHCEIADGELGQGSADDAERSARHAQALDPGCVRARMLLAAIGEKRGQFHDAFDHYQRALESNPVFAAELLPGLQRTAEAAGEMRTYDEVLREAAAAKAAPLPLILQRARRMAAAGEDAARYLAQRLSQKADWESLLLWLELSGAAAAAGPEWAAVRASIEKQLAAGVRYRCRQCGFAPGLLFWQCPSCKQWNSVQPVDACI
jgi:lipopolysaccharide biosynthesis regulator YciM